MPRTPRLPSPGATRREFLAGSAAAALALPLQRIPFTPRRRAPLKLLILGGTGFLGPAVVDAARARGHEVTLFNRGKTDPGLYPDIEQLHGQRRRPRKAGDPEQDLASLRNRKWDAVVDTSCYFTGEAEDSADLLKDAVQQYVFISSLSAYRDMEKAAGNIDEQSPLATCDDKYTMDLGPNFENYGALKAFAEQAVEDRFPGRTTRVRPGYIVGPRDRSDRFTYWPVRLMRGGEVLAPGKPDAEQQIIDVRDLGIWIVHACEERIAGAFNAVGFKGRISTAELLYTGKGTLNDECSFTWVSDEFLKTNGVTSWEEMPCWTPPDIANHAANERAVAAGMTFRPVAETIRDTWAWFSKEHKEGAKWRAGMSAEREAELLGKWKKR